MKKRILSLLMVLVLCFSLVPAEALATETVSAAPAAQEDVRKDEPASSEDGGNGGGEGDGEKDTVIIPGGSSGGEQDDTDSDDSTGGNKDSTPGGGENGGSDDGSSLSDGSAGEGGGIYVPPGTPTEGGGGVYEPTLTEIWCTNRPDSIGRAYDGTTDGNMISFYSLLFTDAESNEYTLYEGTDFTAEKTFDSADAGAHTVTVKLALIGEAANKYRLRAGEEAFTINGSIDQAVPTLTVYLSKTTCTMGEELLPLLSVDGVQEDAAVTYYYTAFKTLVGASEYEGSEFVPKIGEATVIDELDEEGNNTYYIYAKTAATANYKDGISNVAELTVSNDVASVVSADGTETRYTALSFALDNAKDGNTVRLLADIGGKFDICKTITLDLNGYSWNNTATVNPNCTLTLTGSGTVNTVTLGGKLDIQDNRVKVNALNVTTTPSPAMSLNRGTFGTITITAANTTAYDLLANGYAFYDANGVMNGNVKSLTNVTVMPHEHTIEDDGACKCGATCAQHDWKNGVCTKCGEACAHGNIDASTYTCTTCGAALAAKLTVNGSDTYYVGLADALNAAGKSGSNTCTVTLLRSAGVTGVDGNGNIADADAAIAPGHGSSARVLDMNGHSITGGGTITAGDLGDEGHLTITGSGDIDTTIKIENGSLKLDSFSGKITTLEMGSFGSAALNSSTIGTITANDPNITAADLLAQGCVFKNADGYVSQTTPADGLTDVTVVACDHNGTDGFAIDSRRCPYCGADAVAQTALNLPESAGNPWRNFADLQTALDSNRNGGSTLRLLADVSGEYTIDGTQTTGIDLNGYSINGTVYVTGGGEETSFSNSKSAGTVETVVASAGANLAVSGAPAVIKTLKLADGATWENILFLPRNPGYKVYTDYPNMSAYTWYVPDDAGLDGKTELHNINIYRLPITSNTLTLKVDGKNYTKPSVERGTTVQLCAYCNTNGASVTFYVGERKGDEYIYARIPGVYTKIGTTWYYVAEYAFNKMGDYKVYFTASKDGYSVTSADKDLTVSKMTIPTDAITAPTAKTLTYNGAAQELVTPGIVDAKYGTMVYSLSRSASSFSTEIPTKTDAGTYRVYYKVVGSSEYKDSGSKSFRVTIAPKQLSFIDVTVADKTYDGTTAAAITGAAFGGLVGSDTLTIGTDYTAAGTFTDANAGDNKTVNATVTLTRNVRNYTLDGSDSSVTGSGTIKKATAPAATPGELYVYNGLAKTYEVELPALPELDSPKTYGVNISYNWPRSDLSESYSNGGIKFEGRKLSLPILKNSTNIEGRIGTVWMTVVTDNYEDFTLEINVFAKNRIIPVINAPSASDLTYGQTLADSTLTVTGAMKCPLTGAELTGTFAWKNPDTIPNAGDYEAEWIFTPDASYGGEYVNVTGKVTVKVSKADLTFTAPTANAPTYNGNEQALLTAGTATGGTMLYRLGTTGEFIASIPTGKDAGSYTVYYKVTGDSNHNDTAEQPITVTIDPMPITGIIHVDPVSKAYDGTAEAAIDKSKVRFFNSTDLSIVLPEDAFDITNARFTKLQADKSYKESPEAGDGKELSFTLTLKSGNYVLEGKPEGTDDCTIATDDVNMFTITRAAAPTAESGALTIINGLDRTYSFDLSTLLPGLAAPSEYGTITYGAPAADLGVGTFVTRVNSRTGALTLEVVNRSSTDEGQFGTITIAVTTANYEDITLTINVSAANKTVPVPDGEVSASSITYGDTLSKSTITGKMKDPVTGEEITGTFTWKDGAVMPDAGSHDAEWIFTPDAPEYAAVTGSVTVAVDRKSIAGAVVTLEQDSFVYDGTRKDPVVSSVVLDGKTLVYGAQNDYGYSYDMAADAGTYTLMVTGNHNYCGAVTVTWSITPRTVTAPTITVSGAPFVYTGNAFTPGITVTDDLGNVIAPKEYSVSYKDNTNAGTTTVTITDNDGGNYIVSGSTTFTIEKAASAITAAPAAKTGLVYNGTERELVTAGTAAGGTMKYRLGTTGEFGTAIPKAANAGEYTVYYFVEGDANHRDYEVQSLTVSIAKAAVTVTAANKSAFVGDRVPDFSKPVEGTDYTVSGLFGSDKLTGTVKLAYVDASGKEVIPNMAVTGETIIRASGVTAPNGNYTLVFADGKLTVSVRPYYTITATAGIHGSISPSGSVSVIHGGSQSFTITPNTGYAIANVRIDGVSIGAVRYYTFENVTSSHTIEAVFMRVNGNPQTGVMVDETDGSYYESAWQGE